MRQQERRDDYRDRYRHPPPYGYYGRGPYYPY